MNNTYIFRNYTIEHIFQGDDYKFSGYGDISIDQSRECEQILFLYFIPYRMNEAAILAEISDYYERLCHIVYESASKDIYVLGLTNYFYESLSLGDAAVNEAIGDFNRSVSSLGDRVHFINIDNFITKKHQNDLFDVKYYYTYNTIVNPKCSKEFGDWINEEIRLYKRTRKKCVILDLDNTLWGGVLSEDGIEKLSIGDEYPGSAFSDFQQLLLELKRTGVILCLASKNDEDEVRRCFEQHVNMILKFEDFSLTEISWEEKEKTIYRMIQKLGIGMSSVVFIDDSAIERERVSKSLPGITVPDFPKEPYLLCSHFSDIFRTHFGYSQLTDEDLTKTEQYKKKIHADNLKKQFLNEDEFLYNLQMKLTYCPVDSTNVQRIHQLINKVNQFNLTTKRHTLVQLQEENEQLMISGLKVSDRFGDLGLTACSVIIINGKHASIEEFLLSCRILGRRIETEYLKYLINHLYKQGVRTVYAQYTQTSKNSGVRTFYEDFGFELMRQDNEITFYKLELHTKLDMDSRYVWK